LLHEEDGRWIRRQETHIMFVTVAVAADVAAKCTNRPVKLTLNRDTGMSITGARYAFLVKELQSTAANGREGAYFG